MAKNIHELFEKKAEAYPDRTALICGKEKWSYGEIDKKTNKIARYLIKHGIGSGTSVALYFERSQLPILAVLAVLKTGACYVPLNPTHPHERIKHIVEDAKVSLLLTESKLADQSTYFFNKVVLVLDEQYAKITEEDHRRITCEEVVVAPEDLAYILFTSGSTGQPKGIMTEHRNVVGFVLSFNQMLQLTEQDCVYQGFSLGFDGSVEEMWMAFSNALPLVIGTSDIVHSGSETARLMRDKGVTVFSTVPTFLNMINEEDLPGVRLIIVSGEPCSTKLVERWVIGKRRMLNAYGPTECTVNSTVAECVPGKSITIGKPLSGYDSYVLTEKMEYVPQGEAGELYIGGVGVARGYLNQPELSAKHFVKNPFQPSESEARLYRTGDLVKMNEDGELLFLGRLDDQVKIRGHRIELSEIEAVLNEHSDVRAAVVNVYQRDEEKELAAYVVLHNPQQEFNSDSLIDLLANKLPAYTMPSYMQILENLPILPSGKVDRKILPNPTSRLRRRRSIVAPKNEIEKQLTEVCQEIFNTSSLSIEDDFFKDLSGHSLIIAHIVSKLRTEKRIDVSVGDMYRHTTIASLAKFLSQSNETESTVESFSSRSSKEVFQNVSNATRYTVYFLQFLSMLGFYGIAMAPFLVLVILANGVIQKTVSLTTLLATSVGFIFFALPVLMALSVVLKWLIVGRYKSGEHPLWGFFYFRWWLVSRAQALSGVGLFSGTPIMSLYYRLMGAKIGRNTILDTPQCAIYDLISIGEDTCVGSQTQLLGYRIEDGLLKLGSISIGDRCFIGTHSTLGLHSKMGDDCLLDDLSFLPDNTEMKPGETRCGSPAQSANVFIPKISEAIAKQRRPLLYGVLYFFAFEILMAVLMIAILPVLLFIVGGFLLGGTMLSLFSLYISLPLSYVAFCLLVVAIKKLLLPKFTSGIYPIESFLFLRKWLLDALITISRTAVHTLYTTIYLPPWLRMLGAKIGERTEISTVTQISPDLVIIEDESFFADGSMIGGRRFYRGHVYFDSNRIGKRSFVGNNALLPIGAKMGDGCLLGVLSIPPKGVGDKIEAGSEWLGSPSFRLHRREKVEGFGIEETYKPTTRLYLLRCFIDAMRILVPNILVATSGILYLVAINFAYTHLPLWGVFAVAPLAGFIASMLSALGVVVVKRVLMGTFEPVIKPLWCVYVWLNELVNGAYETVGAPALAPLIGTPFFNCYLRMMGCKIGKHSYIGTTKFSEFDLVEIGNYVALNHDVVVQNHLFEDRIMKSDYLKIGNGCSVGNMSVILYGTEMQPGAKIAPLSLLMKGEKVPPHSHWLGSPIKRQK